MYAQEVLLLENEKIQPIVINARQEPILSLVAKIIDRLFICQLKTRRWSICGEYAKDFEEGWSGDPHSRHCEGFC